MMPAELRAPVRNPAIHSPAGMRYGRNSRCRSRGCASQSILIVGKGSRKSKEVAKTDRDPVQGQACGMCNLYALSPSSMPGIPHVYLTATQAPAQVSTSDHGLLLIRRE